LLFFSFLLHHRPEINALMDVGSLFFPSVPIAAHDWAWPFCDMIGKGGGNATLKRAGARVRTKMFFLLTTTTTHLAKD
jgi:hypothetical protein